MMISPPDVGIREIVCHMVMEKEEKKRKERKEIKSIPGCSSRFKGFLMTRQSFLTIGRTIVS